MTLLIIFLTSFIVTMGMIVLWNKVSLPSAKNNTELEFKAVKNPKSLPAKILTQEFYQIPEQHRPEFDIEGIVEALDIKNESERSLDYHWSPGLNGFLWDKCNCPDSMVRDGRCRGEDYRALHKEIDAVAKAAKKQEHAMKLAEVSGSLDDAEQLVERLRREAFLINEVTRELTKREEAYE